MNWNKLKENRCPRCSQLLSKAKGFHECAHCGFSIGHEKFEKVIDNLYKGKSNLIQVNDNFEALQNLGHKRVMEDYGDSPYADRV